MVRLPEYRAVVSLIPGGLMQFMDFGLNLDALKRTALFFREQRKEGAAPPGVSDGEADPYDLYVMAQTPDGTVLDRQSGEEGQYDYSFTARNVFEIFQGRWLPVPFLQVVGQRLDVVVVERAIDDPRLHRALGHDAVHRHPAPGLFGGDAEALRVEAAGRAFFRVI